MNITNKDADNKVILSFPTKIIDNTAYSNIIIIDKLFEDKIYTESKLKKAKRLLKLPKKLDNIYVYILIKYVLYPEGRYYTDSFTIPAAIAKKLLDDLIRMDYLEYIEDEYDNSGYSLSKSAFNDITSLGYFTNKKHNTNNTLISNNSSSSLIKKLNNRYLLDYSKVTYINLLYTEDLKKIINKIKISLENENLKNIQKRLLEENQHCGICISFYGPSGTGKTETILQLAKELKRDIFNYKVADSESKYCGEQQMNINSMFSEFSNIRKKYIKNNLSEPILLINEADALFSKRHNEDDDLNNTANRENNKLQAELLDHIENFDGILFITTNKIINFDNAMERRFLFKVKFDNPTKEIQKSIWKEKFPKLSDTDIDNIISKYNFTGGNISNIRKKQHIEYILSGKDYSLESILDSCKTESIETNTKKEIGFGK